MSVSSVDYLSGLAATPSPSSKRDAGTGGDFLEILQQERRSSEAVSAPQDAEPRDTDDVAAADRDRASAEADRTGADEPDRSADTAQDGADDRSDERPDEHRASDDTPDDDTASPEREDSETDPSATSDSEVSEGEAEPAQNAGTARSKTDPASAGAATATPEDVPTGSSVDAPAQTQPQTTAATEPETAEVVDPNTVAGAAGTPATDEVDAGDMIASSAAAAAAQPAAAAGQAATAGPRASAQAGNAGGQTGKPAATAGQADPQALAANADTASNTGKQMGQESLGARGDWSSIAAEMAKAAQNASGAARQAGSFATSTANADPSGSPVQSGTLTGTPLAKGTVLATARAANTPPGANAADQVSVRIQRAVAEGVDRINLQLRPAQMGQVDVRLEVGTDGRVQATITAERPETLQMLQRDARTLEQALQDAGLEADSGSLNFGLRDQGGETPGRDGGQGSPNLGSAEGTENADAEGAALAAASQATLNVTLGGVDVRV